MPAKPASQIITANDLFSGEVVYLAKGGAWSCDHKSAAIFYHADLATKRLERIMHHDALIVGPYLTAVKTTAEQTAMPAHFREVFRATGPSNRFVGKQAKAA